MTMNLTAVVTVGYVAAVTIFRTAKTHLVKVKSSNIETEARNDDLGYSDLESEYKDIIKKYEKVSEAA